MAKTASKSIENIVALKKNEDAINNEEAKSFNVVSLESPDLIADLKKQRIELNAKIKAAKEAEKAAKEALRAAEEDALDPQAREVRDLQRKSAQIYRLVKAGRFEDALKTTVHMRKQIENAAKVYGNGSGGEEETK